MRYAATGESMPPDSRHATRPPVPVGTPPAPGSLWGRGTLLRGSPAGRTPAEPRHGRRLEARFDHPATSPVTAHSVRLKKSAALSKAQTHRTWFRDVQATPPEKLRLTDLDRASVLAFLDWLQTERGNSPATRNQRLAVIKSLARYTAIERPEFLGQATQILAVKQKKTPSGDMAHLSGGEVKAINAAGCAKYSRKALDELAETAKRFGAGGLAWAKISEAGEITSSLAKGLGQEKLEHEIIVDRSPSSPNPRRKSALSFSSPA